MIAPRAATADPTAPPPPTSGLALDFLLPEELCQDSAGRILCVICNVYVPRGEMNAQQHLGGKKHATQARNVSRDQFLTRKVAFESEHPAAAAAAQQARRGAPSAPRAVKLEYVPMAVAAAPVEAYAAPAFAQPVEAGPVDSARMEREERIAALRDVKIDMEGFMSSVLESDDGSGDEGSGDDNSGEDVATRDATDAAVAGARTGAFAPMKYTAPPDLPDIFEEDAERTGKTEALREILGPPGSNSRAADPASLLDAGHAAAEDFLPLERPRLHDDDSETPATADQDPQTVNANGIGANVTGDAVQEAEHSFPPWLVAEDAIDTVKYCSDGDIALHYEILEFERFMSPTRAEAAVRHRLVQTVTSIVNAIWPQARVDVFGSYATNLYLPSSDIDVCVMNTPLGGGLAPDFPEMCALAQAIRNVPQMAKRVNFIKAKVPLVKIVARDSNVQCDISFGQSNGIQNVPVIKRYIADFPALRPLLFVLKCFLKQRSLNEVFSGGLGSYSVLLMVVSHLQNLDNNFPGAKANLGTALMNFFRFYGRTFNYVLAGIRVKNGGSYFDKVAKYHTNPHETLRYCIEDPNDESNELGRNGFAATRIRKAFGNSSIHIANWKRTDQSAAVTPLLGLLHIDDLILSRRSVIVQDLTSRNAMSLFTAIEDKVKEIARAKEEAPDLPVDLVGGTNDDLVQNHSYGKAAFASAGALNAGRNLGYQAPRDSAMKRRRVNEQPYGFGQPQQGFTGGTRGYGTNAYGQHAPQLQPQPSGMPAAMYDPMDPMAHPVQQQVTVDAYSGYGAPDPRQLSQMQGMHHPGAGAAVGGANGVWDGVNHNQLAMQYQQQQAYDPVYGLHMQQQVPGHSYPGAHQNQSRRSRGRGGGSRGGGRGGRGGGYNRGGNMQRGGGRGRR